MAEADQLPADITSPPIIPDANEPAPGPIDIDLDSDEVIDTPAEPEPEPQPQAQTQPDGQPQKRPPRSQVRIQNLSSENQRLAQELETLRREAEEAKRAAAEALSARDTAERAGMENYGARVKADVAAAEQEMAAALKGSDAEAIVAAQKKLARAAAAEADYDAWASSHPRQEPRQQQQQPQQQQPQQQMRQQPQMPQISEPVRNFMLENEWFNPYQIDENGMVKVDGRGQPLENPNFDPEMRDAALLRDAQIKREIRQGRKPQTFLESDEYFNDIYNHVSNAFPDAFEDLQQQPPAPPPQRPRTPPMQPSRQPVAPVQRQAMPGQQPQKQGNRVQLSGEERSFVDSLVDNGTMRYPRDHSDPNKRGQKMTKQDAYVKYAKERAADQASRGNGGN